MKNTSNMWALKECTVYWKKYNYIEGVFWCKKCNFIEWQHMYKNTKKECSNCFSTDILKINIAYVKVFDFFRFKKEIYDYKEYFISEVDLATLMLLS